VLTEKGMKEMAEAGLAYAGVGVETGSESVRGELLNKAITDAQLETASAVLRRNKVMYTTFNILGIPGTTLEDDLDTLRFNWKLGPDFAEALMFMPYPRTALGEKAAADGLFSGNPDEIPENFKRIGPVRMTDPKKRTRLLYLFPILARHPVGERALRTLIRLPFGPIYRLASRIYEGAFKVLKIYRVSVPPAALARMTWNYLKY